MILLKFIPGIPRRDIWASLFNNHCPEKEDIGLYFFASERERSEIYTDLVEFMHTKDLVMRTFINDVELLILASIALRSDSQITSIISIFFSYTCRVVFHLVMFLQDGTASISCGDYFTAWDKTQMDVPKGAATK
ncbi:uncharacterized protein LOC129896651 [Solanum dulcamara]|uniref:uncharacterized protein LOC129896651 n=1 Tax=Solanum dulcamara TaxID=45834 RepID=UPI002486A5B2|nr:uncharacterized protein LOC129896651 [Solanum dulcamara]